MTSELFQTSMKAATADKFLPSCQKETEITRDEALRSLLSNEDLSDLTLRGSDGTLVIANRCLLASRSPVFGRMLFGQFAEASEKIIDIGYEGAILQAIVEYIYTDTVDTLEEKKDNKNQWDGPVVQFLVNLVEAADYFALTGLCELVEEMADSHMKTNNEVATLFLASCAPECDSNNGLQDMALAVVKRNPRILIDGSNSLIGMLRPWHIEEVLKHDKLPMSEKSCFQLLQLWANADEEREDNETSNTKENSIETSRKRLAAQMTNLIDLADIGTTELSTTVTTSGLVTTEQLSNAYKEKAVRADKRRRTSYEQWRGQPVWKSSRTNVFETNIGRETSGVSIWRTEVLDCPILKSGIHKWSIKILGGVLKLGVASTRWPIDSDRTLSEQQGGWALFVNTNEKLCTGHNNEYHFVPHSSFSLGSIVSFTLDLDGGGILTASIDNNAAVRLFSDMCQDHGEGHGFVPAVSIKKGGVEFLGLEEMS